MAAEIESDEECEAPTAADYDRDIEENAKLLDERIERNNAKIAAEREHVLAEFLEKLFVPERFDDAKKYANEQFKAEKFEAAATAYERLLPLAPDDDARATLHVNLAAVQIKQWKWAAAMNSCWDALRLDGKHVKAMYRRAQAYRGLRMPDDALDSLIDARHAAEAELKAAEDGSGEDGGEGGGEGGSKKGSATKALLKEITTLERNVRKDIDKRKAEIAEVERQKQAKIDREQAAFRSAEALAARRAKAKANPIALPAGSAEDAGLTVDWSGALRRELLTRVSGYDAEAKMMFMEEDGWVYVRDEEPGFCKIEVSARATTEPDGARHLFYELSLTCVCMVAQCRGPGHNSGAINFDITITLDGVDNATAADDWRAEAGFRIKEYGRTAHMMDTHVRPKFLPHLKGVVGKAIEVVRKKDRGGPSTAHRPGTRYLSPAPATTLSDTDHSPHHLQLPVAKVENRMHASRIAGR